jgi:hypothetical protein
MDWQTLSDKLKSLGMQLGKEQQIHPSQSAAYPIETVVNGDVKRSIYGEVFFTSHEYPLNHLHGTSTLKKPSSIDMLSVWAKVPQIHDTHLENIVFLDIETTGLTGGTGTLAFMIGVGRFTQDGFLLNQYFLRHPGEEPALLAALSQFLEPLAAVCTYNGKTFDIPLLNTRYIMQTMGSPFPGIPHFDLLALSRRLWRDRLVSCTLGNIEQQILGVQRDAREVPGYLIPEMYTEYLRSGDARPMKGIFYHNAIDIVSLAALFIHAADLLSKPLHQQLLDGTDLASIGKLFQSLGYEEQATAIFKESIQHELPKSIYLQTLLRYASIFKHRGNNSEALLLWRKAADQGDVKSCEELAKYYEHRVKDHTQALAWTLRGITNCKGDPTWMESLAHRQHRLQRKLEAD